MITKEHFADLAQSHNVIPLVRETLADFDTPISVAARLRGKGKFFLIKTSMTQNNQIIYIKKELQRIYLNAWTERFYNSITSFNL